MALIDKTYFVGDLNIPGTGKPEVEERLNWFIAKYEPEFLSAVLGRELFDAYTAGIAVLPTPGALWTDLQNGKAYTAYSTPYKWEGFRNATTKRSLIANYVYYWWMRNDSATARPDDAEERREYYERRTQSMVRAWNEMSMQVQQLHHYLFNHVDTYTQWKDTYYEVWAQFAPINAMNL